MNKTTNYRGLMKHMDIDIGYSGLAGYTRRELITIAIGVT
jgi:hypothetical protein